MGEESGHAILTVYSGKPPGARQKTRLLDPAEVAKLKGEMKTGKFVITYPKKALDTRRVAEPVATAPQLGAFETVSSDPWLTVEEAAIYARLPAAYLRRRLEDGELPARDVLKGTGHSWRIKRSAIDALDHAEKGEGRYLRGTTEGAEKAHRARPRTPRARRSSNPWVRLGIVSGE
jgi:excisionase family DNA binding protein